MTAFASRSSDAAAEAAEHRFRDLVHEVDGVVWELEPATRRFTFVNRRAEELLGYPVEHWLAAQDFWSTLIDARDRERAEEAYRAVARSGRPVDHEFRATRADRAVVWLRDRVHRTDSGRLRGLMVDVTQQKQLEHERDELLLREQMARAEVEAAVSLVQRLELITEAALTHRSLDDLVRGISHRIHEAMEADATLILLPTDDGAYLQLAHAVGLGGAGPEVRVPIDTGLTGRIAAGRRPLIVDAAGAEVDVAPLREARVHSLVGAPLSADGDLVGVVHAARHRRGFSAEDARLLELVGERVASAIRNVRLFEDAQRARRATEAARQRSVFLNNATTALFAARDAAAALATVARLAVPAIADWCAVDLRERDGSFRRVALAHRDATAERLAGGLLGTLEDAPPAHGALGRALHARTLQWRRADAASDELCARGDEAERAGLERLGAAGYVCAPLVVRRRTLGAITLVRTDPQRPLDDDDVALAGELARRAAVAVDDRRRRRETRELLRLFARLVSGALELERAPVALLDVVESAARAVREEARAKNVAIDLTSHVEARVCGDARRLGQVLQRLLECALRATPTGGRVAVSAAREGGAGVLEIVAAGPSSTAVSGLRLSIARRLLELHGGVVTTARTADRGTLVRLTLPLAS